MTSVRIGQKHRRGVTGERTVCADGFMNVDVTSGSQKLLGESRIAAKTLSPMLVGPVVDEQGNRAELFENFWQFSKLWPTADHIRKGTRCEPTAKWYKFRVKGFASLKGKRRPLPKKRYGFATCSRYNGRSYDYLSSRKQIYVPIYYRLIKDLPAIKAMREMAAAGQKIMIIDGDGPPRNLYPHGLPMTEQTWRTMINDPRVPFGHGYVVAALVAGLPEHIILGCTSPLSTTGSRVRYEGAEQSKNEKRFAQLREASQLVRESIQKDDDEDDDSNRYCLFGTLSQTYRTKKRAHEDEKYARKRLRKIVAKSRDEKP